MDLEAIKKEISELSDREIQERILQKLVQEQGYMQSMVTHHRKMSARLNFIVWVIIIGIVVQFIVALAMM